MSEAAKVKCTLKVAGVCGLAAPIVAFSCILSAIASYAPFNWVTNALSDLGVQAGVTAPIFNFGLVISGFLFLVFTVGLFHLVGSRLVGKAGALLLGLACVSLVCIGVFNESFRPIHFYVSVAFFVFLPVSLLILVGYFWLAGQRKMSLLTLVIGLVAAAPWALQYTIHYVSNVAIPEFISGFAGALWTAILSIKMLKEASR
ncbi:MAG: DUF998 domain-containing protein [Candidatus Bathyarchaeota archaeon]|nr:DUF998 domain-containing protein [Candidatus Bathyarchaeota archaeon]